MSDAGLFLKYHVSKPDGTPVDGAFVLKPDTDPVARLAIKTYAENTADERLKEDLLRWMDLIENPRRLRENWQPEPPRREFCECGKSLTQMAAYQDSDGWSLFWDCPQLCGGADNYPPIDWPFEQDAATPQHLIDLGFVIV